MKQVNKYNLNNEDIAVTPILFARSKKIGKVDTAFYKYYQRSGSIQNSGFSEKRFVGAGSRSHGRAGSGCVRGNQGAG